MSIAMLTSILVTLAPPGGSAFSVEVAADCAPSSQACEGARWSDFYRTWVRPESKTAAEARYALIAKTLFETASELTCRTPDGAAIDSCVPYPGVMAGKRRRWSPLTLSLAAEALATLESGYREDIQVGRGWAKKASNDGGMGRGPGMEACLAQIHPTIAWAFADAPPDVKARAQAGDPSAREQIQQSLLGTDEESVRRCWRAGLRMLIHSRAHCDWWLAVNVATYDPGWDFAMFSMYGTGDSCVSDNNGKTMDRTRLFRSLVSKAKSMKGAT